MKLVAYKWSGLADYARGKGPDWLMMDRLLGAFELAKDGRGRRAYVAWLEVRADLGGEVDELAMRELSRGWYLGEPSFADKLRATVALENAQGAGCDAVARSHDEASAEYLAGRALEALGIPSGTEGLSLLRKGEPDKVLEAVLLRKHTSVSNSWIAQRLAMGHTGAVSRLTGTFRKEAGNASRIKKVEVSLSGNI